MKLTKQGVRDLDFGWKKKVVPPAVGTADDGAPGEGQRDAAATDAPTAISGSADARDDVAPAPASA